MIFTTYNKTVQNTTKETAKKIRKEGIAFRNRRNLKELLNGDGKLICRDSKEIILVGIPIGSTKPKAVIVPFTEKGDYFAYVFKEEHGVVHMPETAKNVTSFTGAFRIYDDYGISMVIRPEDEKENMYVYFYDNHLFVREGKTHKQVVKEEKKKKELENGIWRA